jgi:hypothetical protein
MRKFLMVFLLVIFVFLTGCVSQNTSSKNMTSKNTYEIICPWNNEDECKYAISNIVPLSNGTDEVKKWKQEFPESNRYTIRKLQPEEVNKMISEYPKLYGKLFNISKTEDIWWTVNYIHFESEGNIAIPEQLRLTIYVNEKTKQCIAWRGVQ